MTEEKKNKFQNSLAVTNQPERPKDRQFFLNVKTKPVLTLSRPPFAPLNLADTYSVSCTNDNPFQTISHPNAQANLSENLYQPHTAPDIGPPAFLPYLLLFPL